MTLDLEPDSTALLLIDVQNFVLDEAKHPPRPEFYVRAKQLVLPNLRRLLPAARAAGVEVIYTVMENLTRDGRDRSLDYKLSGFDIARGSWDAKVVSDVMEMEDEIVLPKTSACLFNSTNFDYLMRNMGIDTILCAGFLSDQCVEQTIKAGASRGYRMIGLTDACAANSDERHRQALERVAAYGPQIESGTVLALLTAGTAGEIAPRWSSVS
jgi:nicotinamidase-related amidase